MLALKKVQKRISLASLDTDKWHFVPPPTEAEWETLYAQLERCEGILTGVVIDGDGCVLGGFEKVIAAVEMGIKDAVVTVICDRMSHEEKRAFVLREYWGRHHAGKTERRFEIEYEIQRTPHLS